MIKIKPLFGIALLGLLVAACSNFQQAQLYDEAPAIPEPENIKSFYALNIFTDNLTNENWISPDQTCLSASISTDVKFNGSGSLHLTWDKGKDGCPWLGAGFGWDNWAGKNMSKIFNETAIQFKVRTAKGVTNGLPLAACLEDYSGEQAWIGMNNNTIEGGKVSEEWTTVTLPLPDFEYEKGDLDLSNVKQFIIQFEAAGDLFIDDMKIVPFKGNLKKKLAINPNHSLPTIDGVLKPNEWAPENKVSFDGADVYLHFDKEFLYVGAKVMDQTPLINKHNNRDIWNGDAIEIALSTNSDASQKRKKFIFSDQHLGIRANATPIIWDWKHKAIIEAQVVCKLNDTGYYLEAKIPLSKIGNPVFKSDLIYNLEIAIDQGDENGKRTVQNRWNSGTVSGFHENPSLWGELYFLPNLN